MRNVVRCLACDAAHVAVEPEELIGENLADYLHCACHGAEFIDSELTADELELVLPTVLLKSVGLQQRLMERLRSESVSALWEAATTAVLGTDAMRVEVYAETHGDGEGEYLAAFALHVEAEESTRRLVCRTEMHGQSLDAQALELARQLRAFVG